MKQNMFDSFIKCLVLCDSAIQRVHNKLKIFFGASRKEVDEDIFWSFAQSSGRRYFFGTSLKVVDKFLF